MKFAAILTLFGLFAKAHSREFYLRMFAEECNGLPDKDKRVFEVLGVVLNTWAEDNGYGSDPLIGLYINNVESVEYPYYRTNSNDPKWNWATNIITVNPGDTVKYSLDDYDRFEGNRRQFIGICLSGFQPIRTHGAPLRTASAANMETPSQSLLAMGALASTKSSSMQTHAT